MKNLFPSALARALFALPFAAFGVLHLMNGSAMAGLVPSYILGGVIWVYIIGLAYLAFAVSFVINRYAKLAGYLMAILLLTFVLTIHLPGAIGGGAAAQMAMTNLLKDVSLFAASLFIANHSK